MCVQGCISHPRDFSTSQEYGVSKGDQGVPWVGCRCRPPLNAKACSCDVWGVKVLDSKSNGVLLHRFESCSGQEILPTAI